MALMQWGDRWLAPHGGPVELRHRDCGEPVGIEPRCAAGHRVDLADVDLAPGPGAPSRRNGRA
jgi:hypothetical protein